VSAAPLGLSRFDTIGHAGLIYFATVIFVVGAALSLKAILEARR
jgi:hypothetical protein